jgi:nickel superoxide dismutase
MRSHVVAACVTIGCLIVASSSFAHCEIPCGIYDDEMRLELVEEHISTIEKSMNMVLELAAEGEKNYNQLVRWVQNKDLHADQLREIVSQYFLTQRVKPVEDPASPDRQRYVEQLTLLHQLLVSAMKAKQTTDLQHIAKMRSLVEEFRAAYLVPGKSQHSHH